MNQFPSRYHRCFVAVWLGALLFGLVRKYGLSNQLKNVPMGKEEMMKTWYHLKLGNVS